MIHMKNKRQRTVGLVIAVDVENGVGRRGNLRYGGILGLEIKRRVWIAETTRFNGKIAL